MSARQLVLCLPIDVARAVDHTVSQDQIDADTMLGSDDDEDTLQGFIDDAQAEFRTQTNADMRTSRVGFAGRRETFEQLSYEVKGHNAYRRNWTGLGGDYRATEVQRNADNGRILPWDPDEGDAAYVYVGLSGRASGGGVDDGWEDVTDEIGETWSILNHRSGTFTLHPQLLFRSVYRSTAGVSLSNQQLREVRLAVSYRYGTLGGDSMAGGLTELSNSLTDTETGSVEVADSGSLSTGGNAGPVLIRIGREYVRAQVDPDGDTIDITERGIRGTTAVAHDAGEPVHYVPPSVIKAVAARAGMWWLTTGQYNDYLPDADDNMDVSERHDKLQTVWETTVAALQ